jgi:hypothetical protein
VAFRGGTSLGRADTTPCHAEKTGVAESVLVRADVHKSSLILRPAHKLLTKASLLVCVVSCCPVTTRDIRSCRQNVGIRADVCRNAR